MRPPFQAARRLERGEWQSPAYRAYLADLAVYYLELGLVPVPTNDKLGMAECKWREHQYLATCPKTEAEVRANFKRCGDANGVSTTPGETCGMVWFDADTDDNWVKLDALFPNAPWKTKTKNGGHVVLRVAPEVATAVRNQTHAILHHPSGIDVELDVRGQGGLPVLPGSTHKKGMVYQSVGASDVWSREDVPNLPVLDLLWRVTQQSRKGGAKGGPFTPRRDVTFGDLVEEWRGTQARAAEDAQVAASSPPPPAERRPLPGYSVSFSPTFSTDSERADVLFRAVSYAGKILPAVEGSGGDMHTFSVCSSIVRGFHLTNDEALEVLCEWNKSCQPPWSRDDLLKKIENARRHGTTPWGNKLERRHAATSTTIVTWDESVPAPPLPPGSSGPVSAPRPPDVEHELVGVHGVDPDAVEEQNRIRRRAKKPSESARAFISIVSAEELFMREIERWCNVSECYPFKKARDGEPGTGKRVELHCDEHGKFNEIPMCCSNNNVCPGCAHCWALKEANFVVQHHDYAGWWDEEKQQRLGSGIALMVFDAGPDGTPTEKRDRVRAVSARYRKKKRRKDGIQRAYLAMLPHQLPALVERLQKDGVTGWTTMTYDPRTSPLRDLLDIGHLIYDVHCEPSSLLLQYAEARDRENLVDLMRAMRSKVHRTSGPRAGLPWYSEAKELEAAAEAREKAGLPRKNDGTICTRLRSDGTPCCRRGFHRAMDGDRVLAEGMHGYKVLSQAFAILRGERRYGRGNVHVPAPPPRIAPIVSSVLLC